MKVGHEHPAVPGKLARSDNPEFLHIVPASQVIFLAVGMLVPATDRRGLGAAKERDPVSNEDAERLRAERKAKRRADHLANRERELARTKAYRTANPEKQLAYAAAYRQANKEQRKATQKAHYLANRERERAQARAYYAANREKTRASQAAYREANREKLKADRRAYYAANRERLLAAMKARRAARKRCHHPHLHMIVPGGGISCDGQRWIACRPNFFLPVLVLSKLFRRLMLEKLLAAHAAGKLQFFGDHAHLAQPEAFTAVLAPLRNTKWFVYSKRPFAGPEAVLAYLSRYTHRVAISNSRLITANEKCVTFKVKDYRIEGAGRYKTMTLDVAEFIRRFLIHVLPKGFHRIRHYGIFANGSRAETLARSPALLPIVWLLGSLRRALQEKPETASHRVAERIMRNQRLHPD